MVNWTAVLSKETVETVPSTIELVDVKESFDWEDVPCLEVEVVFRPHVTLEQLNWAFLGPLENRIVQQVRKHDYARFPYIGYHTSEDWQALQAGELDDDEEPYGAAP